MSAVSSDDKSFYMIEAVPDRLEGAPLQSRFNQEPTWLGCSDNYENKFEHRIIGTIIASLLLHLLLMTGISRRAGDAGWLRAQSGHFF